MIVRNEAHIIHELIESVAAHIDHWVIVDTGSTDGTQALVRRLMSERGLPGELVERAWRNFGSNRSEALALAQGRADYIWMMDADDRLVGQIDFSGLRADAYSMRLSDGVTYWRLQLFRDGAPWRYAGVLHEVAVCDAPHTTQRLEGDYHIQSRRLGERNRDPLKYARDAQVLQAEVDRNPDDARSIFYLAQSYFDAGDLHAARRWYERRVAMGGWEEEVFWSLYRVAQAMERAGEPWPQVQDAYLQAWSHRPTRAEPLHAIALHYRINGNHALGHLFAERAASIPLPAADGLFVLTDVYRWRALDEQAVCASWIGKSAEAVKLCETLLARNDLPDEDRRRITDNHDLAVKQLLASDEPPRQGLVRRLLGRSVASGQIRLPAAPALLDEYEAVCLRSFSALGVEFSPEQVAQLRAALAGELAAAFAASPRSEIVIDYEAPVGLSVNWRVKAQWSSVGATYDSWVGTREPPYFGTAPDARVMALSVEAGDAAACPVLDLGAGTGRNTLPLARRGHPVDALEVTTKFAAMLRDEAAREALPVRVVERDLFAPHGDLRRDYGLVVLSEVASDFRSPAQLRWLFELAAACLAPNGRLVFNVFLPRDGYVPDAADRELGQQVYTAIFTDEEVMAASAGLPIERIADDPVLAYEERNLPADAWPPTGWYVNWVSGLDLFDVPQHASPIEMRWLVYRKTPSG